MKPLFRWILWNSHYDNHLDEEDTEKLLFLEELSFDLGLLDDETLATVRKMVDEKLGLK